MNRWEFLACDETMTDQLAMSVAECAVDGIVIGLTGTLGSGKTRFVRGLAVALGVPADIVCSPTFVLCHEYDGSLPIYHYDAYRINSDEFAALGVEEILGQTGIALVEWSDRVEDVLPVDHLQLHFEDAGHTIRQITIQRSRPLFVSLVRLRAACYQQGEGALKLTVATLVGRLLFSSASASQDRIPWSFPP